MKLKTKIQLFSTIWMILLLIVANVAVYYLFHTFASRSEINRVHSHAEAIAETLHTTENMAGNIPELLRAYVPANGMIRIIARDDSVLQTITKETAFTELPYQYQTFESSTIFQSESGQPFAIITRPIIWEDGTVVTLQVAEHVEGFQENMDVLRIVLFASSLFILLPTLLGGHLLGNVFLRPIRELIHAMNVVQKEREWQKIDLQRKSKDEIYEMGQSFNQMIDRLSLNFQKQRDFVSDASHELRTPLSIIDSYARLLKRWGAKKPEVLEESIEAILTETERMKKMSNQLLTMAQSEKNVKCIKKFFSLTKMCEQIVHSFSLSFEREITLHSADKEIWINADEDQLKQVLYILLDNAVKYSEKEIHISLEETDDHVQITVRNDGEGIPYEDQAHIFDRFYRVDKARSRRTGGTGLGLSIASQIMKQHGGNITVESKPKEETVFTIQLPKK